MFELRGPPSSIIISLVVSWQVANIMHAWLGTNPMLREKLKSAMASLIQKSGADVVTVGSICTGWGVGDMCIDALNDSLSHFLGAEAPQARSVKNRDGDRTGCER